jgi:hypothetical protein
MRLDKTIIGQNVQTATEYNKLYYALNAQLTGSNGVKKIPGGTSGFIPFNVNLTLDGVSGVKIYNKLELDTSFLPNGYPTSLDFIVTGIDHKIQKGDWETNLTLTMMPKFDTVEVVDVRQSFDVAPEPKDFAVDETTSSGPTGTLNNINNTDAMRDKNLWLYLAWQQGQGGAAEHYDIANGTRDKYNKVSIGAIEGNWPAGSVASNGIDASKVSSNYNTNPRALAQAFIEVYKKFYDGKVSTKAQKFQDGISTGKTERNGISYSEMSTIFNEVATGEVSYTNLVYFAAIENNFNIDSATSNTFKGMFQIDSRPAPPGRTNKFIPIITATKDGPGHAAGYTKYWKNGNYIRLVYPFIGKKFKSFKNASRSWKTLNP